VRLDPSRKMPRTENHFWDGPQTVELEKLHDGDRILATRVAREARRWEDSVCSVQMRWSGPLEEVAVAVRHSHHVDEIVAADGGKDAGRETAGCGSRRRQRWLHRAEMGLQRVRWEDCAILLGQLEQTLNKSVGGRSGKAEMSAGGSPAHGES